MVRWVRRARLGGDGWDLDPPLSEEREVYRIEILDGDAVVRDRRDRLTAFLWTARCRRMISRCGVPEPVTVRVAQGSAVFGWGAATQRSLWR
jgi:hypothetical protein